MVAWSEQDFGLFWSRKAAFLKRPAGYSSSSDTRFYGVYGPKYFFTDKEV